MITEILGTWSNGRYTNDLDYVGEELVREKGHLYLKHKRGAAGIPCPSPCRFDDDAAIRWLSARALDPVTGYGYTRAQAEMILAGQDPGRGQGRDFDPESLEVGREVLVCGATRGEIVGVEDWGGQTVYRVKTHDGIGNYLPKDVRNTI